MAVSSLMLAGAECPDLATQAAVNITGLILMAIPAYIIKRGKKR